jgi:hypothetical protein
MVFIGKITNVIVHFMKSINKSFGEARILLTSLRIQALVANHDPTHDQAHSRQ